MYVNDLAKKITECDSWKLRKGWTKKWMLDMGYLEGDCECCEWFEQCQLLEELRRKSHE